MPAIRGLTVAVGEWYAKTLEICLVRNMRHMTECFVVTTPDDHAVKSVARSVHGVHVYETNSFTAYGARFNKGLCVEECFDFMGRRGWILIHDADILLPASLGPLKIEPGNLYGASRRILDNPADWTPKLDWKRCTPSRDGGPIGFFQLFHADDPALTGKRPWYDVTFAHAGGGDAYFLEHWHPGKRIVLPIETLHLGPKDRHWFGTQTEDVNLMAKFTTENGWWRAAQNFTPAQVEAAGVIPERVAVPGYEPSKFELPFVQRHLVSVANQKKSRPRPTEAQS